MNSFKLRYIILLICVCWMEPSAFAKEIFVADSDEYFYHQLEENQAVLEVFQASNRSDMVTYFEKKYPDTIDFSLPLKQLQRLVLEAEVPDEIPEDHLIKFIVYDPGGVEEKFAFIAKLVRRKGEYILYADIFPRDDQSHLLALGSCHLFSDSPGQFKPVLFQLKRKELKEQAYDAYFKAGMSEGWNRLLHEALVGFTEVYKLSTGNKSFLKAYLSRVDTRFWRGHGAYSGIRHVLMKRGESRLVKSIDDARFLLAEEEMLAQEEKKERLVYLASLPESQYRATLKEYSIHNASSLFTEAALKRSRLRCIDNWPDGCRSSIDHLNYLDITVTTNTSYDAFHELLTPALLNDNGNVARKKLLSIFFVLFSAPEQPDRNRELLKTIVDQVDFAYDFMGFLTKEERNDHFATGVSKAVRAGEPIPFSLLNQILTRGMLIGEYRSYFDFPPVVGCRSGTRLRLMILLRKIDLNDGNIAFLKKLLPVLSEECWLGTEGDSEEQSWIGFKEILLERGESDLVVSVTKARNAKAEE